MRRRKKRQDTAAELRRLAKYFAEEMAARAWGNDEFERLVKASRAARERVDDEEREATRWVLGCVDRVMSIRVAAQCAVEILGERTGTTSIPAAVVIDVLKILKEQASRAVCDAFTASRALNPATSRSDARLGKLPFREVAAALAQRRFRASDLKAFRAALRGPRKSRFATALEDTLDAATLLEHTIGRVERLATHASRKHRRLEPTALIDLMTFVSRCAVFVQDVVTERIARAVDRSKGKRKR